MPDAALIDGRAHAATLRTAVAREVAALRAAGHSVGLATILVGEDPASAVYVAAKHRACHEVGITSIEHTLPADATCEDLVALLDELNAEPKVSGILCQLPLPGHLDATAIVNRIVPHKDLDGLTIASAGRLASGLDGLRPCTPSGVLTLLARAEVELAGAHAVVLGRSNLFGKPMAQMLLAANATVTVCHSRTRGLPAVCRLADVLIVAVGRAALVQRSWVKPGATVIDVGITRTDGGLVGDVAFDDVRQVAGAITPVPGGVGPMTIACLLENAVQAARATAGLPRDQLLSPTAAP